MYVLSLLKSPVGKDSACEQLISPARGVSDEVTVRHSRNVDSALMRVLQSPNQVKVNKASIFWLSRWKIVHAFPAQSTTRIQRTD